MLIRKPQPRLTGRQTIVLVSALIVVVVVVLVFPFRKSNPSKTQPPASSAPALTDPALPTQYAGFGTTPYPSTIPPLISAAPETYLYSDPDGKFKISYTSYNQLYIILILDPQFDKYRSLAEKQLLKQLNISQSQACKLNVSISSPRSINSQGSQQAYSSLSFCSPAAVP